MEEIVAYAADRQINVIPEIDVPAHSCAALAAYPELACPVVKEKITVLPGLGGRNPEMIYCAGNEKVFAFLQDVIDELLQLFLPLILIWEVMRPQKRIGRLVRCARSVCRKNI